MEDGRVTHVLKTAWRWISFVAVLAVTITIWCVVVLVAGVLGISLVALLIWLNDKSDNKVLGLAILALILIGCCAYGNSRAKRHR